MVGELCDEQTNKETTILKYDAIHQAMRITLMKIPLDVLIQ